MKTTLNHFVIVLIFAIISTIFFNGNYSNAGQERQDIMDGGGTTSNGSVSGRIASMNVSKEEAESNIDGINNLIGVILGFLQGISALISVVVIAFTGFSYITAETPDLKRELKVKMLPLIIGLVLIFGAVSITNFILGVAS